MHYPWIDIIIPFSETGNVIESKKETTKLQKYMKYVHIFDIFFLTIPQLKGIHWQSKKFSSPAGSM